jgi:4-hydroxy-4-methyl-2-oxoglutarate aldolase
MSFPVWSRAISATGTEKSLPGWVNIPVCCGGAIVNPGDVVVADDDGVVIVERNDAAEVLAAADARKAAEQRVRERLIKGESGMDLGRYHARLAGVERRSES